MQKTVILVDDQGNTIGTADILEAHTGSGKLHKAFSIFIFHESEPTILIQRRAQGKMLWPGIWANTCCSHPQQDETALQAGTRRLQEEMGFTCPLSEYDSFVYRAEDPSGRGVEHEHDTILVGKMGDGTIINANPEEVMEWKWMDIDELMSDMLKNPDTYAPWFHIAMKRFMSDSDRLLTTLWA